MKLGKHLPCACHGVSLLSAADCHSGEGLLKAVSLEEWLGVWTLTPEQEGPQLFFWKSSHQAASLLSPPSGCAWSLSAFAHPDPSSRGSLPLLHAVRSHLLHGGPGALAPSLLLPRLPPL